MTRRRFIAIVSLGVLVTFHEFGHYWVARRNGVKVLRFSVATSFTVIEYSACFLDSSCRHG